MQTFSSRPVRLLAGLYWRGLIGLILVTAAFSAHAFPKQQAQQSQEAGPAVRIPRQQAQITAALDGVVRSGSATSSSRSPVSGALLTLRNAATKVTTQVAANGEGVFRVFPLLPGDYALQVHAEGFAEFALERLTLHANEVLTLEISLLPAATIELRSRLPRLPELGPPPAQAAEVLSEVIANFAIRMDSDPNYVLNPAPQSLPPAGRCLCDGAGSLGAAATEYRRYSAPGEYVYTKPRWYDPFNRNRFKGDEPIWPSLLGQQVFLNITATSTRPSTRASSFAEQRQRGELPAATNSSAVANRNSWNQTLRFSFDLFHGDTSFKPVHWRIRITPEISVNDPQRPRTGHRRTRCAQRHQSLRYARRTAGSFRGSEVARSRTELRFRQPSRGYPAIQRRLSWFSIRG
jgi:hypothetical protein